MTFKQMWRTFLGIDAEIKRETDAAYVAGFMAGLRSHGVARGAGFADGFIEGRESVRTHPLDAPIDEEGDPLCQSH